MKCSSCQTNVIARKNFVRMNCPDCGETEIVRCSTCKNLSVKYSCKCGFIGP